MYPQKYNFIHTVSQILKKIIFTILKSVPFYKQTPRPIVNVYTIRWVDKVISVGQ